MQAAAFDGVFNQRTEGLWKGAWYKARVVRKNDDGTFFVRWDAGSVSKKFSAASLRSCADAGDNPLPAVYSKYARTVQLQQWAVRCLEKRSACPRRACAHVHDWRARRAGACVGAGRLGGPEGSVAG